MIIKVERSGGLTGIPMTNAVDAKDLPSALVTKIRKMMSNSRSPSLPLKSTPKGAADHFTYKILIQDGLNQRIIECNEYNIQNDIKSLIRHIERISKKVK
jgi:hypothetical protein